MDSDTGRRSSASWQYFTRKENHIATCILCRKDLSYKTTISNLAKHLKNKHSIKFNKDDTATKKMSDKDSTDTSEDESNTRSSKRTKWSWCWRYFTRNENYLATCNICQNDYSYKTTVTNLAKHLNYKHSIFNTLANSDNDSTDCSDEESRIHSKSNEKKESSPNSTWQYFDIPDSDQFVAKCKICESEIKYESVSELKDHVREHNALVSDDEDWIEEKPPISEKKATKRSNKSPIWQYMKVIDEKTKNALCLICQKQLSYVASISNLRKHLQRVHPHISLDDDGIDNRKKMILSTDGRIFELALSDEEKDPIKSDSIFIEESFDGDYEEEEEQLKSPPKKITVLNKRYRRRQISKDLFRNADDDGAISTSTPKNNTAKPDSIELFGQYVMTLLKELPKHVCYQLQSDFIRQIFAAKLALDTPYSVTVTDKPVTVTINNSDCVPEIFVTNTTDGNESVNKNGECEVLVQNGN